MKSLEYLHALLTQRATTPPAALPTLLWLALRTLEHPELAPYLADPLLPYKGEFLSLDSQQRALLRAFQQLPSEPPWQGMLWGALYRPAEQKAIACRVAVAALPKTMGLGWASPEAILPVSADVAQSASIALTEALRLIEQVGLPPPRPAQLVYAIENAGSAAGDSLGLPLFLATLSALTEQPLRANWGATGALGEGALRSVGWIEAKAAALSAQGLKLLSPEGVATLAEAAARALHEGAVFTQAPAAVVYPLVPEPTFLAADAELPDLLGARAGIEAFEQTVCAALERHGGFLYRRQAGVEEGIRAAFATPEAACAAAIAVQQALVRRQWPTNTEPLLARIGLFRGGAERVNQGYFGQAPGQAVRLMQAAQVGQILLPEELAPYSAAPTTALGMHRLRDLSVALSLCRVDAPEVPVCALPPRTLRIRNHNLPLEPSPLLGRESELASIRGLLEGGRQLVTLTGPGGVGKTRLALQVAAELADRFADGVWFVPLAEVRDEEQLITAIAEAMGLAIRDSRVNFVEALAERRALLVLDNFETVLEYAPRVAQLLRQAPGMVCLATSQALLSLSGEWRFEVAPLTLPEAERLFIERALQLNPSLSLSEADIALVSRICQRLEGMPLAVELAAARTRLFSLTEIEARLDNALGLLVTRSRDVPERQRTIRGALEWSYSLLESEDQRRFLRLSIIPGSFSTRAAEAVCGEPDAVEWLLALEEKSFLRRESGGRWRILTLLRQFAQERLNVLSDEEKVAQKGLVTYCQELARHAAAHLDGPGEVEAFDALESDFEMIRFSMEVLSKGDSIEFANHFLNLDFFLRRRCYRSELSHWCDVALNRLDFPDCAQRGYVLLAKSFILREMNDLGNSDALLDDVLFLSSQLNDDMMRADALSGKGIILVRNGCFDEALKCYEVAGNIFKKENNTIRWIRTLNNNAQAKIRMGKYDQAKSDLEEAMQIGDKVKCTRDFGVSLNSLGLLYDSKCDSLNKLKVCAYYINHCMQIKDTGQFLVCMINMINTEGFQIDKNKKIELLIFSGRFFLRIGVMDRYRRIKKMICEILDCDEYSVECLIKINDNDNDSENEHVNEIYSYMRAFDGIIN